jgi:hypothetical protein
MHSSFSSFICIQLVKQFCKTSNCISGNGILCSTASTVVSGRCISIVCSTQSIARANSQRKLGPKLEAGASTAVAPARAPGNMSALLDNLLLRRAAA